MTARHADAARPTDDAGPDEWQRISSEQFAAFGVEAVAYVRPVVESGERAFAVCAANGAEMGVFPKHEIAFAAIRQHDLEPLSVH
ncbi:MAG: DUF1150 family protein [Alphaproteobacteria bacterium]